MTRAAYCTAFSCGTGHRLRGLALAQAAARAGVELRAVGPWLPEWREEARAFLPDVLLGDIAWLPLGGIARAGCEQWLLVRYVAAGDGYLDGCGWDRRIAIEPAATFRGLTHRVEPVTVAVQRFAPAAGARLAAGYNTWWEAARFGYIERVTWEGRDHPERGPRIAAGYYAPLGNGADQLMRELMS